MDRWTLAVLIVVALLLVCWWQLHQVARRAAQLADALIQLNRAKACDGMSTCDPQLLLRAEERARAKRKHR